MHPPTMAAAVSVIILPGNGCTPIKSANWYSWLHDNLTSSGVKSVLRDMPDPYEAKEKIWLPFIREQMGANENSIIVGHSSGAEAAMRLVETTRVRGVVLVAACVTDLDDESEAISGYYNRPWKWDAMKQNCQFISQFQDRDDPFIPWETEGRVVHEALGTELMLTSRGDHFMTRNFPELLQHIQTKINA